MPTQLAPSKINLFLHVTGRRADGYHLLDSLVVFATIADRVTVEPHDEIVLEVGGEMAGMAGPASDNLVLRAANALKAVTGTKQGARITLEKQIPAGAGLGGGSSDAATTLKLLNMFWQAGLNDDQLSAIGLGLGADVPVCLRRRPTRMGGIGEVLEDTVELFPIPVLLVHPGQALPTKDVFARLDGRFTSKGPEAPWGIDNFDTLAAWLGATRNDLEGPALALRPDIEIVINQLKSQDECGFARMSGSGAASFGLFRSAAAAGRARHKLQECYPHWWIRHGIITGPDFPMA